MNESGHDADTSPPSSPVVKKGYSYTPMDRTACTDPQCLYKGALFLLMNENGRMILTGEN